MNYFIFILLISLFVFLFCIHFLSRDDFVLLRKDISMDKIFNLSFITFGIGLFFARFFYTIFFNINLLLKPLDFILFPYLPGLSLTGGVLGGVIFLIYYLKIKKMPLERLLDFFSISVLSAMPVGYLGYFLLMLPKTFVLDAIILTILYFILFIIFIKFLCFDLLLKGKLKDGTIGILFLFSFSLISLFAGIIVRFKNFAFLDQPQNYILFGAFLITLVFLIDKENLVEKFTKRKKK